MCEGLPTRDSAAVEQESRAISGRTARCRCEFSIVSNLKRRRVCGFPATARLSCWSLSADWVSEYSYLTAHQPNIGLCSASEVNHPLKRDKY